MAESTATDRRPLLAANWKMNKNAAEAEAYAKEIISNIPSLMDRDVVLCPPYPFLSVLAALLKESPVALGAQNIHENDSGAYTGEVSGAMLKSVGCRYVLIGHSERRQHYGETDRTVNKKIGAAFRQGLVPIACVGETLEQRENNQTLEVIHRQLKGALQDLPSSQTKQLLIAYEPVWAIGTGKTATPQQAGEVHLAIRDILKDQYGSHTSLVVRILYGGSVKPENISELMSQEDIDGGLVGGACLDPGSFLKIVRFETNKAVS